MDNYVISAVPLDDGSLIVWFDNGICKEYNLEDLDVSQTLLAKVGVLAKGEGLSFGAKRTVDAHELYENGIEVNFVEDEKVRILKSLSAIRRDAGFSQTRLGEAAGIRQSVISRIEGCEISPQINTLLKLLAPLGKTIAIVDLK